MKDHQTVISIFGSAGGVAKSVLSILNHSASDTKDPIHHLITNSPIHLIDLKQKEPQYYQNLFPHLTNQIHCHQFDLKDKAQVKNHLTGTKTSIVIDVSWADTVEMLQCCDELGIKYVNSALENTYIDDHEEQFAGFPLIERIHYFEKHKDMFKNTSAIVCSGMNPGVVQWMAFELMNQNGDEQPLGCYIVEHDTSFFKKKSQAKKNVIYTTWSPECFLDEAISCYPMFMKKGTPLFLYENVYDIEFKVTLGKKIFYGSLMPHEEVYTLGQLYDMESGFLYKVNEHTTKIIRDHIDDTDVLWDFEMKVLDPQEAPLTGEDLVGVLLAFPDKERYMYNVLDNERIFAQYKTNATYFQVACGIYASLSVLLLDNIPNSVYYVDELLLKTTNQFGQYLTHYMTDFVIGENPQTDGLLLDRMREFQD
ncbi:S-adenosylmethionine decarboxylase related protein [Neobacillus sp. DY30]|uniref:S-adenosylmethionine decarboxylase related protein n=1 Tax=Neobacillus sp. DY30 TaxID=3047871 RepID=UPI0024C01F4C|nr:S-adenosylmethionine decarboxylase related protein [Neobacillus sp. DY30]WHX98208.1 S-adenosylmethionine decarboxylase related protein [Neobacillus sp. DY30]